LVDRESLRVIEDSIEIHKVELAKYDEGPSEKWKRGQVGQVS
jgi:hypothetical protein